MSEKLIILHHKKHMYLKNIFKGSNVYAFDINANLTGSGDEWKLAHDLMSYVYHGEDNMDKVTIVENYNPAHLSRLRNRYFGPVPIKVDEDKLIALKNLHSRMKTFSEKAEAVKQAVDLIIDKYCEEKSLGIENIEDDDETCAYLERVYMDTMHPARMFLSLDILDILIDSEVKNAYLCQR